MDSKLQIFPLGDRESLLDTEADQRMSLKTERHPKGHHLKLQH